MALIIGNGIGVGFQNKKKFITIPIETWNYEGVLTAGDGFGIFIGYSASFGMGSMSPSLITIGTYPLCTSIYYDVTNSHLFISNDTGDKVFDEIEIDGVLYSSDDFTNNGIAFSMVQSPFVIGQDYTIKMRSIVTSNDNPFTAEIIALYNYLTDTNDTTYDGINPSLAEIETMLDVINGEII